MDVKKVLFILLLTLVGFTSVHAQNVKVTATEVTENQTKVVVSYQISPVDDNKVYTTSLFVSMDGGANFQPLTAVSGDIGELKVLPTGTLKVTWDIFKDVAELSGSVVFEVRVKTQSIPLPLKQMVLYNFSPSAPFGVTYVNVRKTGYYVRLKTNFVFQKSDYEVSESGLTNYEGDGYWQIGSESKTARIAATGGFVYRLNRKAYLYGGLGYGSRTLLWSYTTYKDDDTEDKKGFAKVTDSSFKGVEAEVGLMLMFGKSVPVSIGMNTVNFGFYEVNLGIGYCF